jgi:hypothetical protein
VLGVLSWHTPEKLNLPIIPHPGTHSGPENREKHCYFIRAGMIVYSIQCASVYHCAIYARVYAVYMTVNGLPKKYNNTHYAN